MAELEAIAQMLRRHRRDLDEIGVDTLSRRSQTLQVLQKLEELRLRSEQSRQLFEASVAKSNDDQEK
ncbi:MAG TPA: hypothetical protein VHL59_15670 [Thermoanaerobaculia bacterium]|nr:hypothetical protein [Thermoanaerobaculia bacterium]